MQYRELGRTGIKVSEIGFGAWGIGGDWGGADDTAAKAALERAFDLGVTFYDTAYVYGDGHSERLIGDTFADRRDRVVIASKVPPQTYRWPVTGNDAILETFSGAWIVECTEKSLRRLKTDYLDLQQLHAWAPEYVEIDEWYGALMKLKDQGKIRAFGVSVNDWDPYGGVGLVESRRADSIQVIYNIFEQRPEEALLPAARQHNVGIIVRVPFEEGLLTGTMRPGHEFAPGDWRREWLTEERLEEAAERVDALKPYLSDDAPDLATLALKFALSDPAVSTVIPGMRRPEHVEANVRASDGRPLPASTREALKGHAFVHGWAYPWSENELVAIQTFPNTALAEIARQRLEADGIAAQIGYESLGVGIPLGELGVQLQVLATDAERATAILSQENTVEATAEDEGEPV